MKIRKRLASLWCVMATVCLMVAALFDKEEAADWVILLIQTTEEKTGIRFNPTFEEQA